LGALLGGHTAHDLMLQHRLVERHRDLLLGLEANRRLHLLGVLDRRQAQRAHDHALVADPETHVLGELVLGKEAFQRFGEAIRIDDLPLVEDPGRERLDRGRADRRVAVLPDLGRRHAAGLDIEADHRRGLLLSG
jgi:hypothetical protein